jgi:hypothetical protein
MKTFEEFHENDPYNEENWSDEKYTPDQIRYLGYVENRLKDFVEAYEALLNVWDHDTRYGIDLNEWLGDDLYPFDKSFDELNINQWFKNFLNKIQNIK